jgi:hypothetical protein
MQKFKIQSLKCKYGKPRDTFFFLFAYFSCHDAFLPTMKSRVTSYKHAPWNLCSPFDEARFNLNGLN